MTRVLPHRTGYRMPQAPSFGGEVDSLRYDKIGKALGVLLQSGGSLSGTDLAPHLGVAARGLRQLVCRKGSGIEAFMGPSEDGRTETWYRIRPIVLVKCLGTVSKGAVPALPVSGQSDDGDDDAPHGD